MFYFVFAGLVQASLYAHIKKLGQQLYWVIAVTFFFWLAATWFWDSHEADFIKVIESYGAFLSLPIIFSIIPKLTWRDIASICYAFVGAILVVCLICLVKAYLEYQVTHNEFVFSYHYLSNHLDLNAIFLSNYSLASMTWLLYFNFIHKGDKPFKLPGWLVILLCVFLFGMIILLSSKLGIVLAVVVLLYFIMRIMRGKKLFAGLFVGLLLVTAVVFVARNLTYLKFRWDTVQLKMYSGRVDDQNGFAARLLMWQSACELIKERPVLGHGIVHSKEGLIKKYTEKDFSLGVQQKYNAHNQYLETWMNAGIIGLLLWLALLFFPLRAAIREKKLLLLLMVLHYMLQSLVESTLTVQQEQIFFWFFIWLFYYHLPTPTTSEKQLLRV
jgi:O-antigen ligase